MAISPGGTQISLPAPNNIASWINNTATSGTDVANTNGTIYYVSMFVPGNCFITSINYLVGSVGGTDKVIAGLFDQTGQLLANTAIAGQIVGTAAQVTSVPLTQPYNYIGGPATLLVGLCFNGVTAKFRAIPAYCSAGAVAGSATQTFGTPASFVPSTTLFTADLGPVVHLR